MAESKKTDTNNKT